MSDFTAIESAVALVQAGTVTKVEGDGWKVYAVGAVIRIDLTPRP